MLIFLCDDVSCHSKGTDHVHNESKKNESLPSNQRVTNYIMTPSIESVLYYWNLKGMGMEWNGITAGMGHKFNILQFNQPSIHAFILFFILTMKLIIHVPSNEFSFVVFLLLEWASMCHLSKELSFIIFLLLEWPR